MKNRRLSLLVFLLVIPMLTGCASILNNGGTKKDDAPDSDNTNPTTQFDYKINDPDFSATQRASQDEVTYEDLFNLNNKVEIIIDVDREEMQKINDDNVYTGNKFDSIKPETYHLAKKFTLTLHNGNKTFTWELDNVGIKQKGNTSREPILLDNGDIRTQNHFKISFDETFTDPARYSSSFIASHGNEEYKDRELLGLDGLDIKWNKVDDSTHLKEIYSNMILRSAGVLAQHIGLGMMEMHYDNDKVADFGLCSIYEQSNKSFIKRSLQSDTQYINMSSWKVEKAGKFGVDGKKYGDLYKASYGKGDGSSADNEGATFKSNSITGKRLGVKTDIAGRNWPTYERKTNTNENYNDQLMRDAVAVLNKSNATFEEISTKVDIQYLAMEEAVMYFLGSPDAMRYNYNNYMVYFRRTDGKLVIIPIDNDRCFGVGNDWLSGMNYILQSAKPSSSKSMSDGTQRNPLLKKTIFASENNQAKTDYQKCLELMKNSKWLKNETFERYYNILKETYSGLSTFSLSGGQDNIPFATYVEQKLNLYNGGTNEPVTPDTGSSDQPVDGPLFPQGVNLYVVGTFNEWGTSDSYEEDNYILKLGSNNTRFSIFRVATHPQYATPGVVELKIYGGKDPRPAWTYDYGSDGNGHIVKNDPTSPADKVLINAEVGDLVKFTVNEETGAYTAEVEKTNELAFFNWDTPFKVLCLADNDFYEANAESVSDGVYRAVLNFNKDSEQNCEIDIMDMVNFYFYGFDSNGKIKFTGAFMSGGGHYVKPEGKTSLTITINRSEGKVTLE